MQNGSGGKFEDRFAFWAGGQGAEGSYFFEVDGMIRRVVSDGVLIWRFAIGCFLDLMTSTLF